MREWAHPVTGQKYIWDPTSKSWVEAHEDAPMTAEGVGQTFDPAIHTERPSNPEMTGIMAKVAGEMLHYPEVGKTGGDCCSVAEDDDGVYVKTHRSRSKSYPTLEDIPKSEKDSVATTASLKVAADEWDHPEAWNGSSPDEAHNLDPDDTVTFIIAADYNPELGDELRQEVGMGHYTAERLREIAERHSTNGVLPFNDGTGGGLPLDAIDWDHVGMHYEEEARLEDDDPITMPNVVPTDLGVPQSDTPSQREDLIRNASGYGLMGGGDDPTTWQAGDIVEDLRGHQAIVVYPMGARAHKEYVGLRHVTPGEQHDGDEFSLHLAALSRYGYRRIKGPQAPDKFPPEWKPREITDTPEQREDLVRHANATCPNCGGPIAVDGHCEMRACGYRQYTPQNPTGEEFTEQADPFPDRIPKERFQTTDHSFPSMASASPTLMSDMRSFPDEHSSWEHHVPKEAASLDECPDCASPMTEGEYGAKCRGCGTKQPAINVEANQKTAFVPLLMGGLAALGIGAGEAAAGAGVAGLAAEGAAGGSLMGGVGQLMTKAAPGIARNVAVNAIAPNPEEEPQALPQQPNPVGTVGKIAGPQSREEDLNQYVQRGDDSNTETDGTDGFRDEHSGAREEMDDTNDLGGSSEFTPEQEHALKELADNIDVIVMYAQDDAKDGSDDPIVKRIDEALEAVFPGYKGEQESSDDEPSKESGMDVHAMLEKVAARRPKMCPCHSDIVDASLLKGESQLGNIAPNGYGANYCKDPGFEGKCNFKPAMTTQAYWDSKDAEYEQRRTEREQAAQTEVENQRAEEFAGTTLDPAEHDVDFDGASDSFSEPSSEYAPGLSDAPSAVGQPIAASVKVAGDYELVDTTDNDHYDTGSKEEMEEFAAARNQEEGTTKWKAKPSGYSSKHFKSASSHGIEVGHAVRRRALDPMHDDPVGVVVEMTTVHPSSPGRATVRFEGGHEESIPVADLELADGEEEVPDHVDQFDDLGFEGPQFQTAQDPVGDPYGAPAGSAPYAYASKTADHSYNDAGHDDAAEYDFGHGDPVGNPPDSAVANDGQDEAGVADTSGRPLREGSTYLMKSADFSAPDKITIDKISGSDITYTIHTGQTGMDFQDHMNVSDVASGFEFEPTEQEAPAVPERTPALETPSPEGENLSDFKAASKENEDMCSKCGDPTDDGEGWGGMCGNCADKADPDKDPKTKEAASGKRENLGPGLGDEAVCSKCDKVMKGKPAYGEMVCSDCSNSKEAATTDGTVDCDDCGKAVVNRYAKDAKSGDNLCASCTKDRKGTKEASFLLGKSEAPDEHLPWHVPTQKTAGKDFSNQELNELINESMGSTARNSTKMNLEGTHYLQPYSPSPEDDYLW